MDAIDRLGLVVGSLERSLPFYRDLLASRASPCLDRR
jgi:hypothetical protein